MSKIELQVNTSDVVIVSGKTLWKLPSSKFITFKTAVTPRIGSSGSRIHTDMGINSFWKLRNF